MKGWTKKHLEAWQQDKCCLLHVLSKGSVPEAQYFGKNREQKSSLVVMTELKPEKKLRCAQLETLFGGGVMGKLSPSTVKKTEEMTYPHLKGDGTKALMVVKVNP